MIAIAVGLVIQGMLDSMHVATSTPLMNSLRALARTKTIEDS